MTDGVETPRARQGRPAAGRGLPDPLRLGTDGLDGIEQPARGVLVAWTLLAPPATAEPGWTAPSGLGERDRRRVGRLAGERRRAFLAGRALLGRLLTEWLGAGTVDATACAVCGGDHGPVEVRGVPARASVSYAEGLVAVALGRTARLGVDVERPAGRPPTDDARAVDLGRLLGVPAERALRRWTQVEAVLKADGRGLRVDPGRVRVVGRSARVAGDPLRYRLRSFEGPAGCPISVAWAG